MHYLKELIDIKADYESNMLAIIAIAEDQDSAQEILDMVLNNIEGKYLNILDNLGDYSFQIMNKAISKVADSELAKNQKLRVKNLADM